MTQRVPYRPIFAEILKFTYYPARPQLGGFRFILVLLQLCFANRTAESCHMLRFCCAKRRVIRSEDNEKQAKDKLLWVNQQFYYKLID